MIQSVENVVKPRIDVGTSVDIKNIFTFSYQGNLLYGFIAPSTLFTS